MDSHEFKVVALLTVYNEEDIVGYVVNYLLSQGIYVHIIDNGSTDSTIYVLNRIDDDKLVIDLSQKELAYVDGEHVFALRDILIYETKLANTVYKDFDWIIHYDADEIRISPWSTLSLKDGIQKVDDAGYNAINFVVVDFVPTDNDYQGSPESHFSWCRIRTPRPNYQVKAVKNHPSIDMVSTFCHNIQREARLVYPDVFITKHYSIRSQQHGELKVFQSRQKQFSKAEKQCRAHVQYDHLNVGDNFIFDPQTKTLKTSPYLHYATSFLHWEDDSVFEFITSGKIYQR